MTGRDLQIAEICVQLSIDETLVRQACDEGLIEIKHTGEADLISADDAERMRLIVVLTRELDVNFAGVEVILHMRDDLCAMQRQFDEILRELVGELRRRMDR